MTMVQNIAGQRHLTSLNLLYIDLYFRGFTRLDQPLIPDGGGDMRLYACTPNGVYITPHLYRHIHVTDPRLGHRFIVDDYRRRNVTFGKTDKDRIKTSGSRLTIHGIGHVVPGHR